MSDSGAAARLAMASKFEPGLDEIRRICNLPVERPLSPEEVEAVSRAELGPRALDFGVKTLWRQQAEALVAWQGGGLCAPLKVAAGKTLVAFLCAKDAWRRGVTRILLLVPPDLYGKARVRDVPFARHVIDFKTPVHGVGGLAPAQRLGLLRQGWRGLFIYPYSLLQKEQADEEMALLRPEVVICDEVHALKNIKGAVQTRRFLRMMEAFKPKFACMSGTMAKKSLKDYAHLIRFALGERSPLPRQQADVEFWASVLDEVGQAWKQDQQEVDMGSLEPLRTWALGECRKGRFTADEVGGPLTPDSQGYRRAFRLRRNTAPGVVASSEDSLGVSLTLKNLPVETLLTEQQVTDFEDDLEKRFTGEEMFVPSEAFKNETPFKKMLGLLWAVAGISTRKQSKGRWTTPNGDQIEEGFHLHKWSYEISSGFFNELVWQTTETLARERSVPLSEAENLLQRAKDHHGAKKRFNKEARVFLQEDPAPGVDSPMLLWNACSRDDPRVPGKVVTRWKEMQHLDFDGRPERVERVARVCDYKIQAALDWAKTLDSDEGALVWAYNVEMGVWAAEVLKAALGPDRVLHCPSGRKYDELIQAPEAATKIVVAALGGSSGGHARGKNLQFNFSQNYFLQWPRSADLAEQAIGRTHRPGQKAGTLTIHTNHSVPFDHANFNACLRDAIWAHQTEGEQKIVYADYFEQPRIFPAEWLQQRGFDVLARRDVDAALRAVFGGGEGLVQA